MTLYYINRGTSSPKLPTTTTTLLEGRTFEELISILVEKDLAPIIATVEKASREWGVEKRMAERAGQLSALRPRFDSTPLGLAAMADGAEMTGALAEAADA